MRGPEGQLESDEELNELLDPFGPVSEAQIAADLEANPEILEAYVESRKSENSD